MTVAVVGSGSFIAQALRAKRPDWLYLSHKQMDAAVGAQCIINCAFALSFRTGLYDGTEDIDLSLARLASKTDAHFIMLSSRLVYGTGHDKAWHEDDPGKPQTPYARNKWQVEQNLAETLSPDRLTVLRLATLCGRESRRRSFFGIALDRLKAEGKITLDMAAATRRDFMPVDDAAAAIIAVAEAPQAGRFNVGSGFGTACGTIAQALIDGYGSGTWESDESAGIRDAFWLDTAKLRAAYPALPCLTPEDIYTHARACGAWARGQ
ncbi:MAG: NAD-dependent epimerase/dehydratase family protein [Alphaproteobacteria bacterium]|nr:NAD-dependent epimerase/dehydratase family protein [Alphaproteobacteria bacterium]MBU0859527.1 NAD-dependent epimerase/dehydratase family protein [Alphaproteobacteria bacterium]